MNRRHWATALTALVVLFLALPSRADMVMVEQAGLVTGRQSFVIPIQVGGPGQLSVSLKDLGWAGSLADLSFSLSRTGTLLNANPAMLSAVTGGPTESSGLKNYDISEAGTYYACISGKAVGPYNMGLYGLRVAFAAADAPEVALPAAAWLLLSGLGGLIGLVRRRGVVLPGAVAAT